MTIGGRVVPSMPHLALQISVVGQGGAGASEEAWAFVADRLLRFRKSPLFSDLQKVLMSYNTWWDRIALCFRQDVPANYIIGVDVDADLIAVCQARSPGPSLMRCNPMPPMLLPGQTVDFING